MKERGILLPIFSLPSKYGIGDFGYEAYEFIDILSENKIEYWEILPINACNGLPYSPISYYALNEEYISLDKLIDDKLLENARRRSLKSKAIHSDFKEKYYKEAFKKFKKNTEYRKFIKNKEIEKYAEFRSERCKDSKDYFLFLQYILYKQWMELKKYANSKGVKIIGDMPAYPTFESAETEFNPKFYDFKFEAGTPPDYYSENGQKWGSYVYNVKNLKNNNYKYLINRYKYYLELFDKVRIDYFRGYDSFFKIPFGHSGKEGQYQDGISYSFFDELFKDGSVNKDNLIIEDLGDIRNETLKLRNHYDFTRQKILQFAIDLENKKDLDNNSENVVIYAANHDCQTIYGWYKSLSDENKENLKQFLSNNNCNNINVNHGMMQYCLKCKAKIAIVTVQDIIGLDDNSRINIPGIKSNENWSWKLNDFKSLRERIGDFNDNE